MFIIRAIPVDIANFSTNAVRRAIGVIVALGLFVLGAGGRAGRQAHDAVDPCLGLQGTL